MPVENKSAAMGRIVSLDALRGFDMFWIMGGEAFFIALITLINNPFLNQFTRQFDHSSWNGFTFYDLIFPLFLFISGVTLPISLNRRMERGESKASLYRHVIIRTALLI